MSGYKLAARKAARHLNPKKVIFSFLTEEEIRKLSVAKIYKPYPFNEVNHPEKGGLYDPALGPLHDDSDPCATCGLAILQCDGHFGHIDLPLIVVNPLCHKILYTILRLTCRQCFSLQFHIHEKLLIVAKLKLLEEGFFSDIIELEQEVNSSLIDIKLKGNDCIYTYVEDIIKSYIQNLYNRERYKNNLKSNENINDINTKNYNQEFQLHIDKIMKNCKLPKNCIYCNETFLKVTTSGNKLMTPKINHVGPLNKDKIVPILPDQSKEYLRKLWKNEKEVLKVIVPALKLIKMEYPTDIFFNNVILVLPTIFRPISMLNGQMVEHPRTQVYKIIIQNCLILRKIIHDLKMESTQNENIEMEIENNGRRSNSRVRDNINEETLQLLKKVKGASLIEKLHNSWQDLQINVNHLVDRDMNRTVDSASCLGLKQILEKKEGIIRMHMMGKRVNYAARTVITPDPNLDIDEIGIPEEFALKLTYPVPVTHWNVHEIKQMVINGPDVHPGAVLIQNEDGTIKKISGDSLAQREGIAKTLMTKCSRTNKFYDGVKIVHRHLQNGDMLLLNRQPTLHKPSIMAHRARILKAEKTLRLHYANCKAYNADFDGDEMNAHFPQNEVARAEAKLIANVANQYLVPKDGTPLSGLIQDHIISGVRLTMRGQFFNKEEYQHLTFAALWSLPGDFILLPPSILKPKVLWSGKQVISTIIINLIPKGKARINLTGKAKIGNKEWTIEEPRKPKCGELEKNSNTMSEAEVIIRNGELLCGVLDKAHYGATTFGLIHCVYELYGGNCSTKMLSAFGKLFQTHLLQTGFTLGVKDIFLTAKADKKRKKIMKECRKIGEEIQRTAVEYSNDTPREKIVKKIESELATNPRFRTLLDRKYKTALDNYTNEINKICLPQGLIEKFPKNNLQLMVQSGAKGSTVNTMQISCLLGQIELEGKRPPLMISGKSLPSFAAYDPSPRAGGFIDGRFMTGIEPQEFFFHCMAGREGLIDTAVKTSRSGYLQRCLIKHLEGVCVHYDSTVRDSDGSVIQFYYGEDGLDISASKFLTHEQLNFLYENRAAIMDNDLMEHLKLNKNPKIEKDEKKLKKWQTKYGSLLKKHRTSAFTEFSADNLNENSSKRNQIDPSSGRTKASLSLMRKWIRANDDVKKHYAERAKKCPDPLNSKYRQHMEFGVYSENIDKMIDDYFVKRKNMNKIENIKNNELKDEKEEELKKEKNELKDLISMKFMNSLCPPGEAVGLLAAQSIGEPSTQMTLNTFHFAGRGEMNVTLGIPRLREILMMASKKIKTPSMEIPFKNNIKQLKRKVNILRRKLTKCVLGDILENIDVNGFISYEPTRQLIYTIKLNFLPRKYYRYEYHITPEEILDKTEKQFFKELFREIKKAGKISGISFYVEEIKNRDRRENARLDGDYDDDNNDGEESERQKTKTRLNDGEMHESSDEEEIGGEVDATVERSTARHRENQEYDDPDDDEEREMENEDNGENEENLRNNVSLNNNDNVDVDDDDDDDDNEERGQIDRKLKVANSYPNAISYDYDEEKGEWCSLTFSLPLKMYKLDLQSLLKTAANKVILWETPNIKKAFTFQNQEGETILKTDGINIIEMFKYADILQLDRLYSNDIYGISQTYGIEAANRVIVKEVKDVFKMYGITVDTRHLSLIADYMTFDGSYQPMSRKGMEFSASPLQQMTFESSLQFLKNATLQGKIDDLRSPSSRLMLGQPIRIGTGMIDVMFDLSKVLESQRKSEAW
ncbi:DNA-directed RNA polymerase I subunit RPA1 [Leptopilina boulardi]|uniref:DNA-directed RNA polymerase I subunit RPA1 n=1 Tax=Leptopilina boulardi TaxID=63433 RepID=UPI0021F4FFEF|nr:DNA-directed RNA polymerase I subunit RPA1 [Leptopilina boulardi]